MQRRDRAAIAQDSVDRIASGVALLPQTGESQEAVAALRDMVASGQAEVRAYRRSPLHAKAYLCWYDDHAEPGSAVVGSSNLTLAGFSGNTELNVRVTGDDEMACAARVVRRPLGRLRGHQRGTAAQAGDLVGAGRDASRITST